MKDSARSDDDSTVAHEGTPPSVHDSTGRPCRVESDSPFAAALGIYTASDQAQLAALDATARIFLAETIDNLHLINPDPDQPYKHSAFTETARTHVRSLSAKSADSIVNDGPTSTHNSEPAVCDEPAAGTCAVESSANSTSHTAAAGSSAVPRFPAFRPTTTFSEWVREHAHADEICEFSIVRGSTTAGTFTHIITAMTLIHGLPQFHRRCLNGEFTSEHVSAVTRLCRDVTFENLPAIDGYLAERRADVTIESMKKSLAMKIAATAPLIDRLDKVAARRRVDISTGDDGTAYLTLTGPAPELHACYRRIEGFARAVYSGNTSAFGDQIRDNEVIDDSRGIDALMFDILSRTTPQLTLRVRTSATGDGTQGHDWTGASASSGSGSGSGSDPGSSFGLNAGTTPGSVASADSGSSFSSGSSSSIDSLAQRATDVPLGSLFAGPNFTSLDEALAACANGSDGREVVLLLPTHQQWLAAQAKVIVTVPFLTLVDNADLPGLLPDGSPIPAEMARALAAGSATWTRILTDPATGTPVDAKAKSYQIPSNVRQTLVARWRVCTIPGCTRRAETSEIDHINPYDHLDPDHGGLTEFGNLHSLCKLHHQAKTDRRFTVTCPRSGQLEYSFRHGVSTTVRAPDNPINIAHAQLFKEYPRRRSNDSTLAKPPLADQQCPPVDDRQKPPLDDRQCSPLDDRQCLPVDDRQTPALDDQRCPPQEIVGRFHYLGERISAKTRPGPAPHDGQPGWTEYVDPFTDKVNPDLREWFWDNGEPPPF